MPHNSASRRIAGLFETTNLGKKLPYNAWKFTGKDKQARGDGGNLKARQIRPFLFFMLKISCVQIG